MMGLELHYCSTTQHNLVQKYPEQIRLQRVRALQTNMPGQDSTSIWLSSNSKISEDLIGLRPATHIDHIKRRPFTGYSTTSWLQRHCQTQLQKHVLGLVTPITSQYDTIRTVIIQTCFYLSKINLGKLYRLWKNRCTASHRCSRANCPTSLFIMRQMINGCSGSTYKAFQGSSTVPIPS